MPLALWRPWAAILYVGVALIWLVPDPRIERGAPTPATRRRR